MVDAIKGQKSSWLMGWKDVSVAVCFFVCVCVLMSSFPPDLCFSGYENQLAYRKADGSYPPYRREGASTW